MLPQFDPPAWTYTEGGLWPWYYYTYHDLLGLNQPLTAFFSEWMLGAPLLSIVVGVLLAGSAGGLVCTRRWGRRRFWGLVPLLLALCLWGHTAERILHYATVTGVR